MRNSNRILINSKKIGMILSSGSIVTELCRGGIASMEKKVITVLLKAVVVLIFAVFLFVGTYILPVYMRFFQQYVPEFSSIFVGVLLYINLAFVPVYTCLGLAWRVFSSIGKDDTFSQQNAKRLRTASWLALVDVVMVAAFYLFMQIRYSWLINHFFMLTSVCVFFVGLSASIVCFALSKLVEQAAELKQEVDLTV